MKSFFTALLIFASSMAMCQRSISTDRLQVNKIFGIGNNKVTGISNDTTLSSATVLPTALTIREFVIGRLANLPVSGGGDVPNFTASSGLVRQGNNFKLQDTLNGPGSKLIWMPAKGAFRAGMAQGNEWDEPSIGIASVGLGLGNRASGSNAIAIGPFASALAYNSTAIGPFAVTMGAHSIALSAFSATTIGGFTTAIGFDTKAVGDTSIVLGSMSYSNGQKSIAIGSNLKAQGFGSVALGMFNDTTSAASATTINSLNRLLDIGTGTSSANRRSSLVVLNNGKTGIGTVTPDSSLTLVGGFKYQHPSAGNGRILQSDANGGATWAPADYWKLMGNSLVTGDEFIGTKNNYPLKFRSNDTEIGSLNTDGSFNFGYYSSSTNQGISLGNGAVSDNSISLGASNNTLSNGIAVGTSNYADGSNGLALSMGKNVNTQENAIGIGENITVPKNTIAIGTNPSISTDGSGNNIVIGNSSQLSTTGANSSSIVMGANSLVYGDNNTVIGSQSFVFGNNAIALGNEAQAGDNTFSISPYITQMRLPLNGAIDGDVLTYDGMLDAAIWKPVTTDTNEVVGLGTYVADKIGKRVRDTFAIADNSTGYLQIDSINAHKSQISFIGNLDSLINAKLPKQMIIHMSSAHGLAVVYNNTNLTVDSVVVIGGMTELAFVKIYSESIKIKTYSQWFGLQMTDNTGTPDTPRWQISYVAPNDTEALYMWPLPGSSFLTDYDVTITITIP